MVFNQLLPNWLFRGCVWYLVGIRADKPLSALVGIVSNRAIATLKTRKELGRVNYRKDLWDCY